MSITPAIFLFERGQTDEQADATDCCILHWRLYSQLGIIKLNLLYPELDFVLNENVTGVSKVSDHSALLQNSFFGLAANNVNVNAVRPV